MAVVAAILKAGLRIMPHSGGSVGRGIYFASEHAKSAGYGKFILNHLQFNCLRFYFMHLVVNGISFDQVCIQHTHTRSAKL